MTRKRGAPFGNINAVKHVFNIDYSYMLMMASIEEKLLSEGRWSVEKTEEIVKVYRGKTN